MATINIIPKSQLEGANRIDAEYYQPIYFEIENKLKKIGYKTIADSKCKVINFGAYSLCNYIEYVQEGIPYLNVKNIQENFLDLTDIKYITKEVHEILKKSKVFPEQVLLTMAGTIGMSAIAHDLPKETNSNQAIAKITVSKDFSPYFLSSFLNSKYGKLQTKRLIVSNVQPNLLLVQVKSIKIPLLKNSFQKQIENKVKDALNFLRQANEKYSKSEEILLRETIGKTVFENRLTYEKKLSECIAKGRVDAEYYQPKYEKMIEKAKQNCELKKLGEIVKFSKGIEVGSVQYAENGIPFIRVSNLNKFEITPNNQKYISKELYENLKSKFSPKKGEILLSKDASIGIAFVVDCNIEGIISGGILRIKPKEIDPYYLATVLNSSFVHSQIQRDSGGSIINHWKPEQIKATLIPILPINKQKEIAKLILDSIEKRKKTMKLLEAAKKEVEYIIEKEAS